MEENPSTTGKGTPLPTSTKNQLNQSPDITEWHDRNRRDKENHRKRLFIDLLGGPRAFEYTLENFPRKNIPVYSSALRFNPSRDNLYFWGPSWCGKTHLSTALAHKFWSLHKAVYVASIFDFKNTIQRLTSEFNFTEKKKFLDFFINADLLVLHELGRGTVSESGQESLWDILDRRIMARKNGLIMTSNFSPREIEMKYGASIFNRIKDLCGAGGIIQFPPRDLEVI